MYVCMYLQIHTFVNFIFEFLHVDNILYVSEILTNMLYSEPCIVSCWLSLLCSKFVSSTRQFCALCGSFVHTFQISSQHHKPVRKIFWQLVMFVD